MTFTAELKERVNARFVVHVDAERAEIYTGHLFGDVLLWG
jgi:hypothetical protein